jgi:RND family efflux transporter MFP subunit
MRRIVRLGALPLGILIVGFVAFRVLLSMRETPARVDRSYSGPLVEAMKLPLISVRVTVEAHGTVRPSDQIDLVPQVSGVAVWKSESLEAGGFFSEGDLLVQIDPEEYELALRRSEAEVAQSEYRLALAKEESVVARREWERLTTDSGVPPETANPLVFRLPQLRAAEADLKAARARLAESRLHLQRTRLSAPFDGRVRESRMDAGQFVNTGQPIARLYSIEKAEIVLPVPDEDLAWFAVPTTARRDGRSGMLSTAPADRESITGGGETGSEVVVSGWYAGKEHRWEGRLVRAEGELDPRSRMVHLVAEVDRPYAETYSAPLVVGMFVDVQILGREVDDVRRVPRRAVRPGNLVWVVGRDQILRVRPVQVAHASNEEMLVRFDTKPGEKIVLSQLSGVTDGMKVRVAEESAL